MVAIAAPAGRLSLDVLRPFQLLPSCLSSVRLEPLSSPSTLQHELKRSKAHVVSCERSSQIWGAPLFPSYNLEGAHPLGRHRRRHATHAFRHGVVATADLDQLREAAKLTVDLFVKSGMAVGLGSGPGSCMAVEYIGEKLKAGTLRDVVGIPTSALSAVEAAKAGVRLSSLAEHPQLGIAFTDADMVQEGTLSSIVGRRGVVGRESVVKEKAVAQAAEQFVFIVSSANFVEKLGGTVPVIIEQEDWMETAEEVDDLVLGDAEVWRRPASGEAGPLGGKHPLVTEDGHFVLDLLFSDAIPDPSGVAEALEAIPGVVGHGLFLDLAYGASVASADGVKLRTSRFKEAFTE